MKLTQRQAERWVKEWQKILRLQDWTVVIRIVRERDMQFEGRANVGISLENRDALIDLCDPIDDDPESPFPNDHEATIAHELLHIFWEPFMESDRESLKWRMQEQAIEAIARSLVDLKRKGH